MKFKLPNFPKIPHLPRLTLEPVTKAVSFLGRHKISVVVLVGFILFLTAAMWYRSYLLSKMNLNTQTQSSDNGFYSSSTDKQLPTPIPPTPFPTDSNTLGTTNYTYTTPTPLPTLSPFPTVTPFPTPVPVTTTSSSNSSGNSHCTTGSGTPNSWYSDVYPNPPATTNTGSMTLIVYIRDCNQNTAPVSDNLTITLTSSDPTAKINGASSPVTIQAQNGQASFSVSSQNSITDTFTVQDTTANFTVTDIKNNNPSVTFTNSGSSGSGNSNCTTGNGTPNFWYSVVSPSFPITANTGSTVTLTVNIKDCGKNNVSSDNLTLSQTSNDSSVTINGSSAPVSVQAQNGVATFNIVSTNAGTDTFTIQDTSGNFAVTDNNNHNPSIVFSGSSTPAATATPTPTNAPAATDTPTPTLTPVPTTPVGQ